MQARRADRDPGPAPAAPRHRRSLPAYVGAGGIATASHYAVTILCVEALGVAPLAASAAGFAVGATVKYALNYTVAFASRAAHRHAVARFIVLLAALLGANTLAFGLLNDVLGLHYMVAQVLTTGLLIVPGYLASRGWVFR